MEGSPCTEYPPAFANRSMSSGRLSNLPLMGPQSPACRGSPSWRGGKPTAARKWPSCWGAIARRAAAGWPCMPREGDTPYGPRRSRPAHPSRWRPRSSPGLKRPCVVQRASRRRRRCATGCGGHTAWRAKIKPWRRGCVSASEPSVKCRARATPKKPEAIPAFPTPCADHLQGAMPAPNTRPLRGVSPDERRFG
jgi:hypothetical protein